MTYESDDFDGKIGLFVENDDLEKCPSNVGAVVNAQQLDDDPYMKAARSMMTFSIIFGVSALCLVSFEFLCCRICCASVLESLALTAAAVTGGLAYLSFGSEYCTGEPQETIASAADLILGGDGDDINELYTCAFGKGCSMNVTAMVIYLGAAVALCCTPKPSPLLTK